jgi:hypothetical protein
LNPEPSDPVSAPVNATEPLVTGTSSRKQDGTIEKRPHGNTDETLVPKGKGNPQAGPYVPEHHGVDPDTSRDPSVTPAASQTSVPDGRRRAASPRDRHVAYP